MDVNDYRKLANLRPFEGIVKENTDMEGEADSYDDEGLRVAVFHHGEVPNTLSKMIYEISSDVPPEFHDLSSYDIGEADKCASWADMIVLYGISNVTGLPAKIVEFLTSIGSDNSESKHVMEGSVICFVSPVMIGATIATGQLGSFVRSNGAILVGSSVLFGSNSFDGVFYAAEVARLTNTLRARPSRA